jgi:hypothetical protein
VDLESGHAHEVPAVESEIDSASSLEGEERENVCGVARGGEGEEDSEEVEEEGDDDANPQGEGASDGQGQGRGEEEEEEGAIHRGGDEGDVVGLGAPRGDVHDRADVRLEQGGVVGVGRRSESVRVVSVVVVGVAFLEVRGPRDAWREGQGEEPVAAAVEVAAAERNSVAFARGERRREGEEGDREGGEGEETSVAAVASSHPRQMSVVDPCLILGSPRGDLIWRIQRWLGQPVACGTAR